MADLQSSEAPIVNVVPTENPGQPVVSKRQRRPSVRLGDIGEQPAALSYEAYVQKKKQWRMANHFQKETEISKTQSLMNLGTLNGAETLEIDDKVSSKELNFESSAFRGGRRLPDFKMKRMRSNWGMKMMEAGEGIDKLNGGECGADDEVRDFDRDESKSPKDPKFADSTENAEAELQHTSGHEREGGPPQMRGSRVRVSESRDGDGIEVNAPSETDNRDWKCRASTEKDGMSERRWRSPDDGVRMWLNGLGLGRYTSVFEIHEVDDDVLPLLTLEDLKDMGINAVGSRRKMYCAIQKLARGFS